jgi:hypothetical protein
MKFNLRARLTAEFLGSAFLVAAVIGSGIVGERLAGGTVAIALLANSFATGAALRRRNTGREARRGPSTGERYCTKSKIVCK